MDKTPIIEFKNVSFGYKPKQIVLSNLSFSIYENEYICIVGPNGSGKSTLAKVLMCLLKPQSGFISILGQELNKDNVSNIKKKIGSVFENPGNQFIGFNVEDEIAFGLENIQVKPDEMKTRIYSIAKKFDIENLLDKNPSLLSGGQKQKVAIASCLVLDPNIIIFDEASNMLDPSDRQELHDLMLLLKTKYHKTIISITHDMQETLDADRIFLLANGRLIKQDKPLIFFGKDSNVESYGLSLPPIVKLANELGIEPTTNLNKLVTEIVYGK